MARSVSFDRTNFSVLLKGRPFRDDLIQTMCDTANTDKELADLVPCTPTHLTAACLNPRLIYSAQTDALPVSAQSRVRREIRSQGDASLFSSEQRPFTGKTTVFMSTGRSRQSPRRGDSRLFSLGAPSLATGPFPVPVDISRPQSFDKYSLGILFSDSGAATHCPLKRPQTNAVPRSILNSIERYKEEVKRRSLMEESTPKFSARNKVSFKLNLPTPRRFSRKSDKLPTPLRSALEPIAKKQPASPRKTIALKRIDVRNSSGSLQEVAEQLKSTHTIPIVGAGLMLPSIQETRRGDPKRASQLYSEGSSNQHSPRRPSIIHLADQPQGVIEMPMTKADSSGAAVYRDPSPPGDYQFVQEVPPSRGVMSDDIRIFSNQEQLYQYRPSTWKGGRGKREEAAAAVHLHQQSIQLERRETPKRRLAQKQYRDKQRSSSHPKSQKKPLWLAASKKNPDNQVVNLKTSYGLEVQKLTLENLAGERASVEQSARSEKGPQAAEFAESLNIQKITALRREHQTSIDASTESDPRHEASPSPASKRDNSPELRIEEHPAVEESGKKNSAAVIPNRFMNAASPPRPSTQQRLQEYYLKVSKQLDKDNLYFRKKSTPDATADAVPSNHPPFPPASTKVKRTVKQKFSPEVRNKLKKTSKAKVEKVREFVPAVALDVKRSLGQLSDITHQSRHQESHFSRLSKQEKPASLDITYSETVEEPPPSEPQITPREAQEDIQEATFGIDVQEEKKLLEQVKEESTPTEEIALSSHPSLHHQRETSIQEQLYSNKEQLISSIDQVKNDFLKGESSHFHRVIRDRELSTFHPLMQEASLAFREPTHFQYHHPAQDDLEGALYLAGLQAEGALHNSRTGIILENIREETTESAGDSESLPNNQNGDKIPSRAQTVMERRPSTPSFMPDTASQLTPQEKCQSEQQELRDVSQQSPAILEDLSGIESKNPSESSAAIIIQEQDTQGGGGGIDLAALVASPRQEELEREPSPFENTQNMTRLLNLTSDQSLPSGRQVMQASPGSRFSFINDNSGKRLFRSKSKLNLSQGSLMTLEYQNSKLLEMSHGGSLEIMSPPSTSSQMLVSNTPMSPPLGGLGSGGLTNSTGVMGAIATAHDSIEEEEQEIEPAEETQRELTIPPTQGHLLEDDSLNQLSSYLETLTPEPQEVSEKSRGPMTGGLIHEENQQQQRTVVTLQVKQLEIETSKASLSQFTAEDPLQPHGVITSHRTTDEEEPPLGTPIDAPSRPERGTPPRSPRSTRSVISKIHFSKMDRTPLVDRSPMEITLHSMGEDELKAERAKEKFSSSPELKRLKDKREAKQAIFSLSDLPPRYPFGARHASITVPPDMMKRGCSDLLSSHVGSRVMANRDSQTSIDNADLAPVEFNVRAVSRLTNHQNLKTRTPLEDKQSIARADDRAQSLNSKNFILRNKQILRKMKGTNPPRRESLHLQEVRILTNEDIRSKELLPLLPDETLLSPTENAAMTMRAAQPSQHQKNREKLRKLLKSQGGRRPLTPAQKEELLSTFTPSQGNTSPMRPVDPREDAIILHERSKSLTPVPNESPLPKRSSQDVSPARERVTGSEVQYSTFRPRRKFSPQKSQKDSCDSVTLKDILESQSREESKTPDSNKMRPPPLEQIMDTKEVKLKEEAKAKMQFKPGSGVGGSKSTIKGKLHGNMPQSAVVYEHSKTPIKQRKKQKAYRPCKLIEDVERAAAGLGPKQKKTADLGLTGLRKELQKAGETSKDEEVEPSVVIEIPKRKKRQDSRPRTKKQSRGEEAVAHPKEQIMGMAFHKWGRESQDESHNEISVVDDLLSGGARLE